MKQSTSELLLLSDVLRGKLDRREVLRRGTALGMAAPAIATILSAAPDSARAAQNATPATAAADHECVGAITWALETPPANLVPFGSLSIAQTWGHEHMYDSLLEWDRDLRIQPALAESWETPDDMTYVFHLRQDVKFHDGAGMTAADVKYSLEMAADPPEPGVQHGFVNIESVDILDDFTVQVNMTKVDPTLPGVLAWRRYTPIVPEGIYDRLNVLSEGIGTGPFQLVAFVPDNRVVYTCFADYWKPGIPCVKDLTLTILPDEQSRVANLGAGSIDGASFTADVARTFEGNESISAINGLYAAPKVIHFNMTDTSKPWVDVRVRQAINLAVDRQVIIDNVYAGDAELTGPIPPGYGEWPIPEEDLRSTYYVTDVERAKDLMAEAGYADGFEVTCQAASTPQDRSQIAQVIKEQLQQLNITVNVEPLEIGTFAENVGNGNFEWASTARGMRGDPSGFVVDFSSGNGLHDVMFGEGWSNDELDQLYDEALVTLDVEQRLKMYRRIQEIIISEEVANLYTVQDRKFHALNNRVEGMYVSYTGDNRGLREACVNDAE